ncbi:MAG: NAD(P)H-dependent oxidoreductase subunit E [Ornithinibacter sp.]
MRQPGPTPAPQRAPADPDRADSVRAIAEGLKGQRGPLLPILHEVIAGHRFVHDDDVQVVADVLNLSRADVHGVLSFYDDLRRTPPPAHRVALCRGEACQARGAESLHTDAVARWAAADDVEVAEVFCLGLCALGPAGTVDGAVHARLACDRLEELVRAWS